LKKVLDQNQDAEEADVTPARKQHKISVSGMVLGVISRKGDVMLPHFFEMGQRWSTPSST
jgi:hypothetical protein